MNISRIGSDPFVAQARLGTSGSGPGSQYTATSGGNNQSIFTTSEDALVKFKSNEGVTDAIKANEEKTSFLSGVINTIEDFTEKFSNALSGVTNPIHTGKTEQQFTISQNFRENGSLESEDELDANGVTRKSTKYGDNGEIKRVYTFYENGSLESTTAYANNKPLKTAHTEKAMSTYEKATMMSDIMDEVMEEEPSTNPFA